MKNYAENSHGLSFKIDPDVVYINTKPGQQSFASLTVTVTNIGASPAVFSNIGILLPKTITTTPDGVSPEADASRWVFKKSTVTENQFDALPVAGTISLAPAQSFSFLLGKIKLVNTIAPSPVKVIVKVKLDGQAVFTEALDVAAEPAIASIEEFSVTPAKIKPGISPTITWRCKSIDRVIIDPDVDKTTPSGSEEVRPLTTTTYTLYAFGKGVMLFAQLTVEVENIEVNFTSNIGSKLRVGQNVALEWICSRYVKNVILTDTKGIIPQDLVFTGADALRKKVSNIGPVTDLTTFKLLATSDAVITADTQYVTKTITVDNVLNAKAEFTANPATNIFVGGKVKLDWDIESVRTLSLTPPLTNGPSLQNLKGGVEITLDADVTYNLEVTGFTNNLPVKIVKNIPLVARRYDATAAFIATPDNGIWERDKVVLSWDIAHATNVSISPGLANGPSVTNLKGSVEIFPESDVSYLLTVTGFNDNKPATITKKIELKVSKIKINRFELVWHKSAHDYEIYWDVSAPVRKLHGSPIPSSGCLMTRYRNPYRMELGTTRNPVILIRDVNWDTDPGPTS